MLRSAAIRQLIWVSFAMSQQSINAYVAFPSSENSHRENKIISIDTKINESYLNSKYLNNEKFWFEPVLLKEDLKFFKKKLDYLIRNYEKNKNYQIFTFENEAYYFQEISLLSKDVFKKMSNSYFEREKERWIRAIYQFGTLDWIKGPVEILGLALAVYQGHSFRFRLSSDITLMAWAGIRSKIAKLFFELPWIQGRIEYSGKLSNHREPDSYPSLAPLPPLDERYRFTLSKQLSSEEHMVARLTYLSTSNLLTLSVSKEVLPHLNCLLATFYPVNSIQSDSKKLGEVVQFDYGIEF